MAKRTNAPPAPDPEPVDESLIALAELLLSEHFFDPDEEQTYKQQLSENRPAGGSGLLLDESSIDLPNGSCDLRLEALRTWTRFRIGLLHPTFAATVEGAWNFSEEKLSQAKVNWTGDLETLREAVDVFIEDFEASDLDDDEFAEFMNGLERDDDEDAPLIGDDPTEPPEATTLDRNRVKAIAKRAARKPDADLGVEDRAWLEQTPQALPTIAEALIGLAGAAKRDEPMILAYHLLLALQLEFVRYRQDRGWDWADAMLQAFQQRLITLGRDEAIPRDDWFMMCTALSEARVPLSDATQTALADAGFKPEDTDGPPEQMMRTMRGFMDELARMVSSPFEVIHSLQSAGAVLPAMLRGFMATELALSPHQVLRDAVPLMLLDADSTVRHNAAAALDQTARPDAMSADALRRAIVLRNWVPESDRSSLDAAVRKARLAGVEIGAWPATVADLEFHASTIDGSGAQSILAVSRSGKKGVLGGLLLRHGAGVVDTWVDQDLSRGKINKLLREAKMSAPFTGVGKAFVDAMVQNAIGTAVEREEVPPIMLLEVAELLGGGEWRDRRLDIRSEAERLFNQLDPRDRTPEGIEAGFTHGLEWMTEDDLFSSWFEDGPQVQHALAKLPRTDKIGMTQLVMTDVLPNKRAEWAERFLMMALWSAASDEARQRARASDLAQVAHALTSDQPIGAIPIMAVIAMQTVRAMLLGNW